jgi:tetratricopeptide (TPR) repeat protein
LLSIAAGLAVAAPALAADSADTKDGVLLNAVVRAQLAEDAGDASAALAALGIVASLKSDLPGVRVRMLEQAIQAGDLPLASSAALRLWQAGDRRLDAQLVLVVDALRRSDWKAARTYVEARADKTGGAALDRLIGPIVNGWIDVGARTARPERHLIDQSMPSRPEPALMLEAALIQLAARRPADAVALADKVTLTDRTSQLVALRLAAGFDRAGEAATADRLRGRIALAAGGRDDPALLLPDQSLTTPRAGVGHWFALLADGVARAPGGNPRISVLFARAAYWLNKEDWQIRAALIEALDHGGQSAGALVLLANDRMPLPPVLAMRRAELLADAGDITQAVALARQAAAQKPPVRSLLIRFADLAQRADDPAMAAEAYAQLETALEQGEPDPVLQSRILMARADLLLQAQDWDAARPLLDQALAIRPDDAMLLNFAGYSALERRKDMKRSVARIEAAWKHEPQNPSITDSLGWAYLLTGRTDEAVTLLEKAQRGAPDNAVIVEHLGDAYWQAGQKFSARYSWDAAALIADADMATRLEAKLRDGLTPATMAP